MEEHDYGDATRRRLSEIFIFTHHRDELRIELAAMCMLDLHGLVRTTYQLEGDRLELLLVFERVEALRSLGRFIKVGSDGALPNMDAVLRSIIELKKGVKFEKFFLGHGIAEGKLEKQERVESTLYPGQERNAWHVWYADGTEEDSEEEELRSGSMVVSPSGMPSDGKPFLIDRDHPSRLAIIAKFLPAFLTT